MPSFHSTSSTLCIYAVFTQLSSVFFQGVSQSREAGVHLATKIFPIGTSPVHWAVIAQGQWSSDFWCALPLKLLEENSALYAYTEINLLPSSIYLTASTVQLHTPHAHLCFGCWKPGSCVDALSGNLPLLPTFLSPVVLAVTRAVLVLDTKVAHSGKAFSSVHPFPEAGQV